jgi:hypothetical protein
MSVQEYVGTLTIVECGAAGCGVTFGLTGDYVARRRADHVTFYCPNGHPRHYPHESETEKARRERDNALQRAQQLRNLLDDEQEQHRRTERRLKATRGVVTRTKRRIAAGACPRCHARFPDLRGHMESEHPDYGKDAQHIA